MANTADDGERDEVDRLRRALRSAGPTGAADAAAVEAAVRVIARLALPRLSALCERLVRSTNRPVLVDADDLIGMAWEKTLRHLAGPSGDKVKSRTHLIYLLRRAARTCFLDALDDVPPIHLVRASDGPAAVDLMESVPDGVASVEDLALPLDSRYLDLVRMLFADPEGFKKRFRQANQRSPKQYQALVLYQAGYQFAQEALREKGDCVMEELLRNAIDTLGIPASVWEPIENSLRAASSETAQVQNAESLLLAAVNAVCGTTITSLKTLHVYRFEMNRFAAVMR